MGYTLKMSLLMVMAIAAVGCSATATGEPSHNPCHGGIRKMGMKSISCPQKRGALSSLEFSRRDLAATMPREPLSSSLRQSPSPPSPIYNRHINFPVLHPPGPELQPPSPPPPAGNVHP